MAEDVLVAGGRSLDEMSCLVERLAPSPRLTLNKLRANIAHKIPVAGRWRSDANLDVSRGTQLVAGHADGVALVRGGFGGSDAVHQRHGLDQRGDNPEVVGDFRGRLGGNEV